MEFKFSEWTVLLCFCAFGIQSAISFVQNMIEMEQACVKDGGFCINVIVPQPRKRPNANANRRAGAGAGASAGAGAMAGRWAGAGAGRRDTRTRKGSRNGRPDPRALGQQHTRLPASAQATAGAAGTAVGAAAAPPPYAAASPPYASATPPYAAPPAQTGAQTPAQNSGFFFGGNSNDPFGNMISMMMFNRKKRQAPVLDPSEIAEIPRRRKNQSMYGFLNVHCRKSEFDFGCTKTGGMCCHPFPR